jgi:SAM-dependent methyltransferase
MINQYLFPVNFKSVIHVYRELKNGRSILRLIHNFFLKKITINGKTLDIGSKDYYSAYEFMRKDNDCDLVFLDNYSTENKDNLIKMNIEEKLAIENNVYDTVILFNVIEHVENYKQLITEINRILKKNGKLELFVPFLFRYHEDPKDFVRLTHYYLKKILEQNNFQVELTLVGPGPFTVCLEIISKYLFFALIKTFFFILFTYLDRIIFIIKKNIFVHYLGIHCSCSKIK